MARLTHKFYTYGNACKKPLVTDKDVWNRLAAYEDTGLAPDEVERYKQWVNDLQSGMYVNCVYCGHRYGPSETTPVSMADSLKQHIENCPKHPMSELKSENARLIMELDALKHVIRKKRLVSLDKVLVMVGEEALAAMKEAEE